VPTKDNRIWLSGSAYLVVQMTMVQGRVVSFVVRLMALRGDFEHTVARDDTAQGAPHRDRLDRKGSLREKRWLLGLDLDAPLNYAVEDFKNNYEHYLEAWE
jgi:hypothetical protein